MRIKKLEKLIDKKFCFLCTSGSTALYILIKSLGIKKKKILIPANICYEIVLVILYSGNIPEVVDVDKDQCLSHKSLVNFKRINEVSAIIYPYMYGNYGEIFKVKKFADKKKILLIEDIAPSLGLKILNKYAGSLSDYSFSSFGKGKIIDMGIGGSVNVNSFNLYKKIKIEYKKFRLFSKRYQKKKNNLNNLYLKVIKNKKNRNLFEKNKLNKFKYCFVTKYEFNKIFHEKLNKKILDIKKINNLRNKKAELFQKIIKNKKINLIKHKNGGVYWRQNAYVGKKYRDKVFNFLTSKKIYVRKFFPSLDSVFPFIKKNNLSFSKKHEETILNFWPGQETSINEIKEINKFIDVSFNTK